MNHGDDFWLAKGWQIAQSLTTPSPGNTAIYVARAFLESVPDGYYERHPSEWTIIASLTLKGGATMEAVAKSGGIDVAELRRRLGSSV